MVYGRVYSIRSHQTSEIYIGSTTQILCKRMSDHRRAYQQYLNEKMNYITSYKLVQHSDAFIELLFEGEFESVDALKKKEGEYIRSMECVNKLVAGRTPKEWREENREKLSEQKKQYYEDNREEKLENANQYYKQNKESIKDKHKLKFTCACGAVTRMCDKSRHERSKKHQAFIASQ